MLLPYPFEAPQRVFDVSFEHRGFAQVAREIADTLHSPIRRAPWSADRILHDADQHAQRVAAMAVRLGQRMGVGGDVIRSLRRGALLHDLGKHRLPDGLLGKRAPLTAQEWLLVRRHPQLGFELARHRGIEDRQALLVILHHHERWDGTGYPLGLHKTAIPLVARVTALCDVFDALASEREYKEAWPLDRTLSHIEAGAGTQFDPELTAMFLESAPYALAI